MTARPLLWLNGTSADPAGTHLSILDRGFTLADGLFETMRVYGGRAFRLAAHLERLGAGLQALGIAVPPSLERMVADALAAAAGAGLAQSSLRLTVSRGPAPPGLAPPDEPCPPTVALAVHPAPRFPAEIYESGIIACVPTGRRNEHAATAGLKTLSYTDAVIALAEARSAGSDDALMLDTAGHLSEATSSNVFVCANGQLATPPRSCGALPGVTRAVVFECAAALGVTCEERELSFADLCAADEAFLTSSLREIVPLVKVDDRLIGRGVPGPVTRRVMAGYAALVRRECGPLA